MEIKQSSKFHSGSESDTVLLFNLNRNEEQISDDRKWYFLFFFLIMFKIVLNTYQKF